MDVREKTFTARQAADYFAANNFAEPREVGCWLINPARFQLVGGIKWYGVECLADYSGWRITVEGAQVSA